MLSSRPITSISMICCALLTAAFSLSVALSSCSIISAISKAEAAPASGKRSFGEQMTQSEAERSAIEEFIKHGGGATVNSYKFEKLLYLPDIRRDMALRGYFLCGRLEYALNGKTYGPSRIMVNFSTNKILMLILYDDPNRGTRVASAVCDQVEELARNP